MTNERVKIIREFVKYCKEELNILDMPQIKLTKNSEWVRTNRSFGEYNPDDHCIKVYYATRNTADIVRSIAHELVHHRQNELGMLGVNAGETGSEIENEANALAGILLRDYGKLDESIYDLEIPVQSLQERKQVGTIYHFTSYGAANEIIKSDFKLKTVVLDSISFTRNFNLKSSSVPAEVRFTLDGDKLSDKYSIKPHADVKYGYGRAGSKQSNYDFTQRSKGRSSDETEERISKKEIDVKDCILSIDVLNISASIVDYYKGEEDVPPYYRAYKELLNTLEEEGIKYNLVDSFTRTK
jgi:hypothetical protein